MSDAVYVVKKLEELRFLSRYPVRNSHGVALKSRPGVLARAARVLSKALHTRGDVYMVRELKSASHTLIDAPCWCAHTDCFPGEQSICHLSSTCRVSILVLMMTEAMSGDAQDLFAQLVAEIKVLHVFTQHHLLAELGCRWFPCHSMAHSLLFELKYADELIRHGVTLSCELPTRIVNLVNDLEWLICGFSGEPEFQMHEQMPLWQKATMSETLKTRPVSTNYERIFMARQGFELCALAPKLLQQLGFDIVMSKDPPINWTDIRKMSACGHLKALGLHTYFNFPSKARFFGIGKQHDTFVGVDRHVKYSPAEESTPTEAKRHGIAEGPFVAPDPSKAPCVQPFYFAQLVFPPLYIQPHAHSPAQVGNFHKAQLSKQGLEQGVLKQGAPQGVLKQGAQQGVLKQGATQPSMQGLEQGVLQQGAQGVLKQGPTQPSKQGPAKGVLEQRPQEINPLHYLVWACENSK